MISRYRSDVAVVQMSYPSVLLLQCEVCGEHIGWETWGLDQSVLQHVRREHRDQRCRLRVAANVAVQLRRAPGTQVRMISTIITSMDGVEAHLENLLRYVRLVK